MTWCHLGASICSYNTWMIHFLWRLLPNAQFYYRILDIWFKTEGFIHVRHSCYRPKHRVRLDRSFAYGRYSINSIAKHVNLFRDETSLTMLELLPSTFCQMRSLSWYAVTVRSSAQIKLVRENIHLENEYRYDPIMPDRCFTDFDLKVFVMRDIFSDTWNYLTGNGIWRV